MPSCLVKHTRARTYVHAQATQALQAAESRLGQRLDDAAKQAEANAAATEARLQEVDQQLVAVDERMMDQLEKVMEQVRTTLV